MPGVLDGLRVLEWAGGVAGGFCGKLLSDYGAMVVKLEPPGRGDPTRSWGPFSDGQVDLNASGLFLYLGTGKRSVILDPTARDGREEFLRLFRECDILIEDHTAAQKTAAGLDVYALRGENPKAVITSVTPFGQDGPYRDYLAGELIIYHLGGYARNTPTLVEEPETHPPLRSGGMDSEVLGGAFGAVATIVSLFGRDRSQRGAHVDVSCLEGLVAINRMNLAFLIFENSAVTRLAGSRLYTAPTGFIPCKDGYVNLHCGNNQHWARFKEVMGNPDWADTELMATRESRGEYWTAFKPLVCEWAADYTRDELYHMFQQAGTCCFPLLNMEEVHRSEVLTLRHFFQTVRHPKAGDVVHPGPPFQLPEAPATLRPAPLLGEHTTDPWDDAERAHAVRPYTESSMAALSGSEGDPRLPSPHRGEGPGRGVGCGPLAGIRVLDLSRIIGGPSACQLMAQMGAYVIKVESRRNPDLSRIGQPYADGVPDMETSGYFHGLNAAKRSVAIDILKPEGQSLLDELAKKCDALVENFTWDAAKRLGINHERFARLNPSLVYVSMAGLGRTEPYGGYLTWGPQLMAMAGWDSITGHPGEPPAQGGGQLTDNLSGVYVALSTLLGLRHRLQTGKGQYVDLSMLEALLSAVANRFMEYSLAGRVPGPHGNGIPWAAPYGAYPCKGNDRWVAVAVRSDEEWLRLCEAVGHPEWTREARFAAAADRVRHRVDVDGLLASWTRERDPDEVMVTLQAAGVPAGRTSSMEDLVTDEQLRARNFLVARPHPRFQARPLPGQPFTIDGVRAFNDVRAPLLGEHTEEILGGILGLTGDEISRLRAEGVVE